ncbi:MAG: nucleotide exchange factor GrpE [Micrococcus sp.]|nr:nucleotide exchange factor GrpE [Micrococcus sp.]
MTDQDRHPDHHDDAQHADAGREAADEQPAPESPHQDPAAPENPAQDQAEPAGDPADGDALSQAEQILNEAGVDAEHSAAAGSSREAELEADLRRLQAEYVNYKRRVDRDRDVAKENGTLQAVMALLPVLDDIDAARAAGDLADGPMAAIAAKLDHALEGLGLERHDQETLAGTEFDPATHEAVMRQPHEEVAEEHIIQVFRNGYVRNGRVLRAAQVMVSAGTP